MATNQRKLRRQLKVAEAALDRSLAARPCGACTACCTVLGVEELTKPMGKPCEHLCSTGCGIYAQRPASCRTFQCLWRAGLGTPDERPDKVGIVMDMAMPLAGMPPVLVAREATAGAFQTALSMLHRLGTEGHVIALVTAEKPRRVIGPPDLVARAWPSLKAMHDPETK